MIERLLRILRDWFDANGRTRRSKGTARPMLGRLCTAAWAATADILVPADHDALQRLGAIEARLEALRQPLIELRDATSRPGRHATRLVDDIDSACRASGGLLLHTIRAMPWSTDAQARVLFTQAVTRLEGIAGRAQSLLESRRILHAAGERLETLLARHAAAQPVAVTTLDIVAVQISLADVVEFSIAERASARIEHYEQLLEERAVSLDAQVGRLLTEGDAVRSVDRDDALAVAQRRAVDLRHDVIDTASATVRIAADTHLTRTPVPGRTVGMEVRHRLNGRGHDTRGVTGKWPLLERRDRLALLVRFSDVRGGVKGG